jgi:tRNA(Arg) A34 adenosine deaminase TadA
MCQSSHDPAKGKEELLGKRDPKLDGYYVCHNLWVFLSHPPCVMCSMALTHSRVARVYYFEAGKGLDKVCGVENLVNGC